MTHLLSLIQWKNSISLGSVEGILDGFAPDAIPAFWLWQFFGRLHPLIVHFPIALLVVALLLEGIGLRKGNHELRKATNILLLAGAASAIIAVAFGWLLEAQEQYSGDLLTVHKWTGIATAALATLTLLIHQRMLLRNQWRLLKAYRIALVVTVLGVSVAGHFGASLTHGDDFLTSVLPWNAFDDIPRNPNFNLAAFSQTSGELTDTQIADLNLEVRSIFAHNCYKCHSSAKVKGDLRLDKKDLVFKGGESGKVIVPGDPDESEMIRRLGPVLMQASWSDLRSRM